MVVSKGRYTQEVSECWAVFAFHREPSVSVLVEWIGSPHWFPKKMELRVWFWSVSQNAIKFRFGLQFRLCKSDLIMVLDIGSWFQFCENVWWFLFIAKFIKSFHWNSITLFVDLFQSYSQMDCIILGLEKMGGLSKYLPFSLKVIILGEIVVKV